MAEPLTRIRFRERRGSRLRKRAVRYTSSSHPDRNPKRSHVAMLLGCTAVALVLPLLLALTWPELVEPLELWTVDVRFQHRPPLPVSRDSLQERSDTLVAIDYDDLAARKYRLGRWPWD